MPARIVCAFPTSSLRQHHQHHPPLFVGHTTPRLFAIFVASNTSSFRLSIAVSPSRRPAARRQTQSTILANLTRPLCAAAQRLCLAQALAIRATRGGTQAGTSSAKRFGRSSHTTSCRHPPLPPSPDSVRHPCGFTRPLTRSTRRLSLLRRRSLRGGGAVLRLALRVEGRCYKAAQWPSQSCSATHKARVGGFLVCSDHTARGI